MQTVTVDLQRLNLAIQFAQENLKNITGQQLVRMVQEAIIQPAPPKDAPEAEKAVEASAEGETNG